MKEPKDITKTYKDNLKDFEVIPDPKLWSAIEKELPKGKNSFFSYWNYAVVAILALGLIIYPLTNDSSLRNNNAEKDAINKTITNAENKLKNSNEILNKGNLTKEIQVVSTADKTNIVKEKDQPNTIKLKHHKKVFDSNSKIVESNNNEPEKEYTAQVKNLTIKEKVYLNNSIKSTNIKIVNVLDNNIIKKPSIFYKVKKNVELTKIQQKKSIPDSNKWSISPTISLFNTYSYSKNSSIGEKFKQNKCKSNNNYSYGVNVSYKLSKKWKVQSGVNIQNYTYTTQNVTLYEHDINTININTKNNNKNILSPVPDASSTDEPILKNVSLQQNFNYITIPIEFKYSVLNSNKINLTILNGVNTSILNSNDINTTEDSKIIGKTTNLKPIHFSGNIGLELNYTLTENISFRVAPNFNTHFNNFYKKSNDFKPYSLGVRSGISYNF